MKFLSAILSVLFFLSVSQVAVADTTYSFIQGKKWNGVKIGGKAPRSLDSVCRHDVCYQFKTFRSIPRELMKKYDLENLSFDQLAAAPGVKRKGNRLSLPDDLGAVIYRMAFWDYMREFREDNSLSGRGHGSGIHFFFNATLPIE